MATPDRIGRYRIESVLGRGAMGIVYKAHDPDIDRTVAIKLVRADLLEGDDRTDYLARFRNEAKMVGRCIHPNIVAIHDFAVHDGNPFLVLEYVDGHHLGRHTRHGGANEAAAATTDTTDGAPTPDRLSLPLFAHVADAILSALAYAHDFGIVHRDIKPANVLLTANATVKVTDFGISRALTTDGTVSAVLVGTPAYMSPEQCVGGSIDGRSDLFSLGCLLYELLAGERAFTGANYVEITHRILTAPPPSLRDRRPDLSAALDDIIATALAK